MAFVYSQPRWSPPRNNLTPGPGSHSPDLIKNYHQKGESYDRGKIRKGKAFTKTLNKNEISKQQTRTQPFQNNNIYRVQLESKFNQNIKKAIKEPSNSKNEETIRKRNQNQNQTLQIKSIGGKIVYLQNNFNKQCQKSQKTQKTQECWDIENIMMKKTNPSIKDTYCEYFYIGSKQQHEKSFIKNANPNFKSKKKIKRINERTSEKVRNNLGPEIIKSGDNTERIQFESRLKMTKPISAQHPFRKKQEFFQPQSSKYQEKSTGIQQEDTQFIPDAVPGPGSYQIQSNQQTTKKSMMFTEKNMERFQNRSNSNELAFQFIYDHKHKTCKSVSRASQARVAFGRALKSTNKYGDRQQCQTDYYQNFNNMQNKLTKIKLKDALNPGFFTSKVPRFKNSNQEKKLIKKDQINDISHKKAINYEKQTKIAHPFNSVVARYDQKQHLTSKIDYSGQNYKTIQQDIQNICNHPRYYQNIDVGQEIEYKGNQQAEKKIKSDIEIKNHLIEDMYGFRQRQNKKKRKKQIKGYSFSPKQQKIENKQNTPSPTDYYKEKDWIKSTFNLKFMEGNIQKNGHSQKEQRVKVNQFHKNQQIKLLRI